MNWLLNLWGSEPVVITGIVGAVIGLLVSLNVGINPQQIAAVDAVIVAISVLIARSQVTSSATQAKATGVALNPPKS